MAGIEDYYRNGMRVPPGPSVQMVLGPKAMQSPLDLYFANLKRQQVPAAPITVAPPVPASAPADALPSPEDDAPGPGMWTQRTNPSLELPSWIKNPSEILPTWENPSNPRQTAPTYSTITPGITPGPIPPQMTRIGGQPYNPLSGGSANTGLPHQPQPYNPLSGGSANTGKRGTTPDAAAPAAATPPSLDEMLRQAQIDALTSTANQQGADYSGLEKAAGDLQNNKWESLMRFGFGTAAGESPFFGVNVGQGGLAMLDARDEGLARYNTAMQNIAQLKETQRSNMANERVRAIDVAKPPATGSTAANPVLTSYLDTVEKQFEQERAAVLEGTNPLYMADPAAKQAALNDIEARRLNTYASLGILAPSVEIDLSD